MKANWPALKPRGSLHFVNPPQSPPLLPLANATSPSLTVLYKVSSVGQKYCLFYPRYLKLCFASGGGGASAWLLLPASFCSTTIKKHVEQPNSDFTRLDNTLFREHGRSLLGTHIHLSSFSVFYLPTTR